MQKVTITCCYKFIIIYSCVIGEQLGITENQHVRCGSQINSRSYTANILVLVYGVGGQVSRGGECQAKGRDQGGEEEEDAWQVGSDCQRLKEETGMGFGPAQELKEIEQEDR